MPILAFFIAAIGYTKFTYHWTASWSITPLLLAFTVNHLAQAPQKVLQILSYKPLQLLGLWSYSIYLWQQPLYRFLGSYKNDLVSFYSFGIGFIALSIAIGYLSFRYIESPIRIYMNKRW
jgi:peptidoglycan/LPS O-acetylase OafA/YrhL